VQRIIGQSPFRRQMQQEPMQRGIGAARVRGRS
jgi:hypothetical protein